MRRQLPGRAGAPGQRDASRGRVRPGGVPQGDRPGRARWWRRVRRHPGLVAAVAVLAALAAAAGITVIMTAGGSHRAPRPPPSGSAEAWPAVVQPDPRRTAPVRVVPGRAARPLDAHQAAPSASPSTPSATMPAGAPSPGPPSGPGTSEPSASPSQHVAVIAVAVAVHLARPGLPAGRAGQAAAHVGKGKPVSGFFVLTAAGGPVSSTPSGPGRHGRQGHGLAVEGIPPGQRKR